MTAVPLSAATGSEARAAGGSCRHGGDPGGLGERADVWGVAMAQIVLRVRLVDGGHVDVTYDEAGVAADEILEHVVSILAEDTGVLRCRHGDRLIVLYGRGVATLEVAPRGAIL